MYALEWDPLEIEFPDPWIKRRDESVHDSAKQKMIGCILCGKQRDRMVSLGNLDEKENVVFSKEFSQELEKNPIYSEKRENFLMDMRSLEFRKHLPVNLPVKTGLIYKIS